MKNYYKVFIIGLKNIGKWINGEYENYVYFASSITFMILLTPLSLIKDNDLDQRTAYALGVITKIKHGKKTFDIYEFYIGDQTFKGADGSNALSKIRVGDSIIVAYEYTNPHNNEIYCYFEYRLDRSKLPDSVFYLQAIDSQRRPLK